MGHWSWSTIIQCNGPQCNETGLVFKNFEEQHLEKINMTAFSRQEQVQIAFRKEASGCILQNGIILFSSALGTGYLCRQIPGH